LCDKKKKRIGTKSTKEIEKVNEREKKHSFSLYCSFKQVTHLTAILNNLHFSSIMQSNNLGIVWLLILSLINGKYDKTFVIFDMKVDLIYFGY
jgi:hypothetical protein